MERIGRSDAVQILENVAGNFRRASSNQRAEKEVYLSKSLITERGVETGDGVFHTAPYKSFWLGFIDDKAQSNWMHPCRYVFINEYGNRAVINSIYPLSDEEMFGLEKVI